MAQSVDLLEAWRLWAAGTSMQQVVLWDTPLLWWGRATWARGSAGTASTRLRQLRLLATLDAWRDFRHHWLSGVPVRGLSRSARASLVLGQLRRQRSSASGTRSVKRSSCSCSRRSPASSSPD